MNLQDILDFVARHLLTQNDKCLSPKGTCQCQQGSLRCAAACLAIESDVTQWIAPTSIPSLCGLDQSYEDFICDFIRIHDDKPVESWPRLLNNLALKHGLQPFGVSDLQGRRGKVNPLSVWYTNPTQRTKLLEDHKIAGTESLLADYLKAFPLDTSGIRESVLPTESQGVV